VSKGAEEENKMITTKQRAYLRGLANTIDSIIQMGKGEVTENWLKTVSDALEARELIKITVLETCAYTPRELSDALCQILECDAVQTIGRKIVLYRESRENKKIVLPK
jgi:RNA-binding protein